MRYQKKIITHVLAGLLALPATVTLAEEQGPNAVQVVSALEDVFGATPGQRRNHIKGTCATGKFVGLPAARRYTRSALFSGKPVPVVARFSLPGGNPNVPDTARSPRGMALEFQLPDGQPHHMTMLNTPVFGAATPQTFLDDLVAKKPDPTTGKPDPEKLKAFKESHPDSWPQADFLAKHNPPASWASSLYFGIHTFKFLNKKNKTTLVRWRFVPKMGEKLLTEAELASMPPHFLEKDLISRTQKSPVQWDMVLTIGQPGDVEDNPTIAWPSNRQEVTVGTLTISAAMPQKGAACEAINFDPMVMADGIEPTNDPVLQFRSSAYAVSFAKRLGGQ